MDSCILLEICTFKISDSRESVCRSPRALIDDYRKLPRPKLPSSGSDSNGKRSTTKPYCLSTRMWWPTWWQKRTTTKTSNLWCMLLPMRTNLTSDTLKQNSQNISGLIVPKNPVLAKRTVTPPQKCKGSSFAMLKWRSTVKKTKNPASSSVSKDTKKASSSPKLVKELKTTVVQILSLKMILQAMKMMTMML